MKDARTPGSHAAEAAEKYEQLKQETIEKVRELLDEMGFDN